MNRFGCIRHEVMITATHPEKSRACHCEPISSAQQQAPDSLGGQCGATAWIFASGGEIDIDVGIGQPPSGSPICVRGGTAAASDTTAVGYP